MMEKVSCWMLTNKDGMHFVRAGAWEVSFSTDGKNAHTVTFSGPEARRLAHEYQAYMKAYLDADALLA